MSDKMCQYCRILDTAGNHEWNCPLNPARIPTTTISVCDNCKKMEAENQRLRELCGDAGKIIKCYRTETPLGNQPCMIAHVADEFLQRLKEEGIIK